MSIYAKTNPAQFHLKSETMIEPLVKSLCNRPARVKVEVIKAIGNTIRYGNNKSVDDVLSHLAKQLFDTSFIVRLGVTQIIGNWLLELLDRFVCWQFYHLGD